jgi:hypothetical protein
MPQDPNFTLILCAVAFASIAVVASVTLRGWRDWIALKHAELQSRHGHEAPPVSTTSRIEVADLKERVKKLEAIAAGIDL